MIKIRNTVFYTNDIEKAKSFYADLGFEIDKDFGAFVSYKTEDNNIWFSINQADDPSKIPGKQTCALWSSEIEKDYEKIKDLGVEFVDQLHKAPFGKTFSFRDPDGNKIEYVEEK